MNDRFTLYAIVHGGRLAAEAILLCASIARRDPNRCYDVVLAEPAPGPHWPETQALDDESREVLNALGADIRRFDPQHFGARYPYGNKIEGLSVLDAGRPFLFLDTDTLVLAPLGNVPFDFARPTASLRRQNTWPKISEDGPDLATIWGSLYDRFGLDFASSLAEDYPADDWRRYLYFNAGAWFYRDPEAFRALYLDYALSIRHDPPDALGVPRPEGVDRGQVEDPITPSRGVAQVAVRGLEHGCLPV